MKFATLSTPTINGASKWKKCYSVSNIVDAMKEGFIILDDEHICISVHHIAFNEENFDDIAEWIFEQNVIED